MVLKRKTNLLDYGIGFRTRSLSTVDENATLSPVRKRKKESLKAKKNSIVNELKAAAEKSDSQSENPLESVDFKNLAPKGDKESSKIAPTGDKEAEDRIVNRIRDEIHAWTIPQALERERALADSWMKLTKSLVGNLKLIFNNNLTFSSKEDAEENLKMISAGDLEPSNLTIDQFWGHPASATLWKFARIIQTDARSNVWAKWWATKVNGNWKQSPRVKLDQYLQGMDYFNTLSDQFWSQMAFNPTYRTQEGIVADLTRLGDFIRLSGIESPIIEEYYKIATQVAKGSAKVDDILIKLKNLWPSSLNPLTLHYGKNRFARVVLDQCEDTVNVKMTATMKNYRFNPR